LRPSLFCCARVQPVTRTPKLEAKPREALADARLDAITDSMAQLIVRNLEEDLVEALKLRAARHGRSAEAEHRELLRAALLQRAPVSLKNHLLAMPDVGSDADLEIERGSARGVEL
jgi:plasmid stability protein